MHILETPAPVFGFTLCGDNEDFAIYINPTNKSYQLRLPSSAIWRIMANNNVKKNTAQEEVIGEFTSIDPYELVVLMKSREIKLSKGTQMLGSPFLCVSIHSDLHMTRDSKLVALHESYLPFQDREQPIAVCIFDWSIGYMIGRSAI